MPVSSGHFYYSLHEQEAKVVGTVKTERRKYDEEIMAKLDQHSEKLLIIDELQQVVLKRLDTINGTVADYNANKYKLDLACRELIDNREDHKSFVSTKAIVTISSILGLLITISTLLTIFGIRIGG